MPEKNWQKFTPSPTVHFYICIRRWHQPPSPSAYVSNGQNGICISHLLLFCQLVYFNANCLQTVTRQCKEKAWVMVL